MSNKFITKVRPVNLALDENHFEQDDSTGTLDLARTGEFFVEARALSGGNDNANELAVDHSVAALVLKGLDGTVLSADSAVYGSKNLWHAILKLDADAHAEGTLVDASIDAIQVDISEIRDAHDVKTQEIDNSINAIKTDINDLLNGTPPVMQLKHSEDTVSALQSYLAALVNQPPVGWCYYVRGDNDLYVRVDDITEVDLTVTIAGVPTGFIRIDNYLDQEALRTALKEELDASVIELQLRASTNEALETQRKQETDDSIDALELRISLAEDLQVEEVQLAMPRKVGGAVVTAIDPTEYDGNSTSDGFLDKLVYTEINDSAVFFPLGAGIIAPGATTPTVSSFQDLLAKLDGSDADAFSLKLEMKLDGLSITIARDPDNNMKPKILTTSDIASLDHDGIFATTGPAANSDVVFFSDMSATNPGTGSDAGRVHGLIFAGRLFQGQQIGFKY